MKKMILSHEGKRNALRCVIVQDENNKVNTYYDNLEKILEVVEKVENEDITVVKVFNPSQEPKDKIIDMLMANLNVDGEKIDVVVPDVEFMFTLLQLLTDIELDLDMKNEDDIKVIQEMISDPSDLLRRVYFEVTNISDNIFFELIKNVEKEANVPQEIKELLACGEELQENVKQLNKTIKKQKEQIQPSPKKKNTKKTTKKVDEVTDNVNIDKESDING